MWVEVGGMPQKRGVGQEQTWGTTKRVTWQKEEKGKMSRTRISEPVFLVNKEFSLSGARILKK